MARLQTVYAIHTFEAENDDEIAFSAGEPVIVFEKDDGFNDGWWRGRNVKGEIGLFPKNYTSPNPPKLTPLEAKIDKLENVISNMKITPKAAYPPSVTPKPTHTTLTRTESSVSLQSSLSPSTIRLPNSTSNRSLHTNVLNSLHSPVLQNTPPEEWNVDQVAAWLQIMGFGAVAENFKAQEITGDILLELTQESLKELDVNTFGKRFKLHNAIHALEEVRQNESFSRGSCSSGLDTFEDSASVISHRTVDTYRPNDSNINPHQSVSNRINSNVRKYPDHQYSDRSPSIMSRPLSPSSSVYTTTTTGTLRNNRMYPLGNSISEGPSAINRFHGRLQRQNTINNSPSMSSSLLHPVARGSQQEDVTGQNSFNGPPPVKSRYQTMRSSLMSHSKNQTLLPVASRPSLDIKGPVNGPTDPNIAPDMQGWLHKQGDKYRTWNRRWFALKGPNLFYYKTKDGRMKGIINLHGYRVICDETIHAGKYCFKVQHERERTFCFYTDTEIAMKAWVKALMKSTISRNLAAPVMSSSTVPTISLDAAQRMKPRPPSVLYKREQRSQSPPPSRPLSQNYDSPQPIMRMSLSEGASMCRMGFDPGYANDKFQSLVGGAGDLSNVYEDYGNSPTKDSGFVSAHNNTQHSSSNSTNINPSFYEEEDLIDPLHDDVVSRNTRRKPEPPEQKAPQWMYWKAPDWVQWINQYTSQGLDKLSDLHDGESLISLLEGLSGKTVRRPLDNHGSASMQMLDKIVAAFKFMGREGVVVDGRYTIKDVFSGNEEKLIEMMEALKSWHDSQTQNDSGSNIDGSNGRSNQHHNASNHY
ncbi:hypothetical protein PHYBLDRAFT_140337 [Phycomyces blakesleeanus NRRL 1555(-)]|uniref:Uncharacterized protein n=1 Tax=Phycomyces blakesleeanus (strain ATCC 8743b / DSM 1359 / FGSC 10004 / NBRC 33097 / NRRL 1555) TaxID=763407 RepID=A0A167PN21_PHYB8|nr:hypothetical protein PHYBLDRAFT_140337 [Phycomyces blakesleeanus NRRL 1555(-)]OAD78237.1 hypothetical protein PHYBLDRAFT_140337 [Phycomyces blakesleeanus NRRL 1555(-)]|eukprot:XP_018296277.1 hypothetical protein PHYBLDRAFT_140337 [Phycomyces blakesleeanus NRRL 1555(-)]